MDETVGGNSAANLMRILECLFKQPGIAREAANASKFETRSTRWEALKNCLSSNEEDESALRRVVEFRGLPRKIRLEVETASVIDPREVLRHFGEIESMVNKWTDAADFGKFIHNIDEKTLVGLSPAAWQSLSLSRAIIDGTMAVKSLRIQDLADLTKRIDQLYSDVLVSDGLSAEVRVFIAERLTEIRKALGTVTVSGDTLVQQTFDAMLGGILRRPDLGPKFLSQHSTGRKIAAFLSSLALVVGIGVSVKELLPGSGAPPAIEQRTHTEVHVDVHVNGTDNDDDDVVECEVVGNGENVEVGAEEE